MKRLFMLFKIQFNVNFGISALKYRFIREKKKRWEPIAILCGIILGFTPLLILYTLLMFGIFMAGNSFQNPQPEMVITLSFLLSQMFILVFGIFFIMGSFYFSRDIETLVPLPLKPYEVVGSKFLVVMVNEYLTALPLLLPPLLVYGIGMGEGVFYWLKGILAILMAPVIPLAAAAVFIVLLMRVVNLRKSKDLLAIVGGFAGLFLALGVNLFIQSIPKGPGAEDYLNNLLRSQTGLINSIGAKFPPSLWVTYGLSDNSLSGWGYFILFIAVSAALFCFLLWLSNILFYKALLAGQEVSGRKRALTSAQASRQYDRMTNPVRAILSREWKLLLRTPIYVINGLSGVIIGPFMLMVVIFARGAGSEAFQLMDIVRNPEYQAYVSLGLLGVILFTTGINLVASTSLSREGNTFWIAKMIPVAPEKQVLAKLIQGYMVSVIGVISTCLIAGLFLGISFTQLLVVSVAGLVCSAPLTAINLVFDVFHPKLVWNSEQEAMKQNMNGILGMLAALLFMAVMAGVAIVMLIAKLPAWAVFAAIILIAAVFGVLSIAGLFTLAKKRYVEFET